MATVQPPQGNGSTHNSIYFVYLCTKKHSTLSKYMKTVTEFTGGTANCQINFRYTFRLFGVGTARCAHSSTNCWLTAPTIGALPGFIKLELEHVDLGASPVARPRVITGARFVIDAALANASKMSGSPAAGARLPGV